MYRGVEGQTTGLPAQRHRHQDEVAGATYRNELGKALQNPQQHRLQWTHQTPILRLHPVSTRSDDKERGQYECNRAEQLYQNVERRAGRVLIRISDSISDD